MLIVPPEILKIAREFLGLSQEQVEARSGVSRATIQRIERGVRDLPQYALLVQHFYEVCGIEFVAPAEQRGWGLFNHNMQGQKPRLNHIQNLSGAKNAWIKSSRVVKQETDLSDQESNTEDES